MLRSLASIAPSTALSRSASSKTINGALPPSSIETFRTLSAESAIRALPTPVEPVKESLRSLSSLIIGPVTKPGLVVWTTFITPFGRPMSSRTFTKSIEVNGVRAAGLRIMVQPAAMAGAILRVAIASGKFHGVINSDGPIGFFRTMIRFFPSGAVP